MSHMLVQILVFVVLGLLLFFLFRRGGLGCCGGRTDRNCACAGETEPGDSEYSLDTPKSEKKSPSSD